MTGHEATARRIALAVVLPGCALFVPVALIFGAPGVAAVVLGATLWRKSLCWAAVRRRLGFRCDAFAMAHVRATRRCQT